MAKGKGNSNCQLHNPKHTFSPKHKHTHTHPLHLQTFPFGCVPLDLVVSTLLSLLKLNFTHFSFILFAHISLLKLSDAVDSFVCLSCPSKWPHLFSIATPCPLFPFSLFLPFMLSNNGKEIRSVLFLFCLFIAFAVFLFHTNTTKCV